ncbi:hypothetical protein CBR_g78884 [Chara braunii]|uniref:PCI domain-containing protein n=1 Tax=Chara braunii TaxID=69332 RepID=A0A388KAX8_CHABU|nr:hypothetical protein CBR_g78884 [Chara braunii]|eukprot:GBG67103.1 hypothetical protein CBR_g78884 [Chara braunii]
MAGELNRIIMAFANAVEAKDGGKVAEFLQISKSQRIRERVGLILDRNPKIDLSHFCSIVDTAIITIGEALAVHFRAMQAYQRGCFVDAYTLLTQSSQAFLSEFRNQETMWPLDCIKVLVYDLRMVATRADKELAMQGKLPEKLTDAGRRMMSAFSTLTGTKAKRGATLSITCQLFKVYFKLNTVNLCRHLINTMEKPNFYDFNLWPASERVTYNYYTGRLEVLNDNFEMANKKLSYALAHCHRSHRSNIRIILMYLVPVKASTGVLPSYELLKAYHLYEYIDVVRAIRSGDVRLLKKALLRHEDRFLKAGVYLVLEKLETVVYRQIIKRIYLIQKQRDADKAHLLKLDVIHKAFKWLSVDIDFEEVECIMSTLIYKGYVKGYISHKNKVVVLKKEPAGGTSKDGPFPAIGANM